MRGLWFATFMLLAGCAALSSAAAQSFNCNYARTADEVLICQDERLSRLDERLAAVYARVRNAMRDPQDRRELEFEQASWLKSRQECGRSYGCVEDHYRRRIDQLRGN